MNTVYQANTSIEAHMIKNLLWQHEIDAEILGEHLQGGVGELQAIGLVRVVVTDSEMAKASDIIQQWEEKNASEESDYSLKRATSRWGDLLTGFFLGVATMMFIAKFYP